MGEPIPRAARDRFGEFRRSEATTFRFQHEWIQDQRFYGWAHDSPDWDISCNEEGCTISLLDK